MFGELGFRKRKNYLNFKTFFISKLIFFKEMKISMKVCVRRLFVPFLFSNKLNQF